MKIKLAVVGGRNFNDYKKLSDRIFDLMDEHDYEIIKIISGGATGADTLAEQFALDQKIETLVFYPDWTRYGKSAGPRRNRQIIEACDVVIAFWDGQSRGTKNSIELANELNKTLFIVKF